MPSCEFQLDHANGVYYSGEEIKGRIILLTQNNIMVNAVLVILEGEAICEWSGFEIGAQNNYRDKEETLHYRIKVFDGPSYFPAGRHVYNIKMRIPDRCPSTCEGRYGHISYEISVKLDRPLMFDTIFRKQIIVYQPLDLNDNPRHKLPVEDENTKFVCLWPCRSGPILSSIAVPFSGYIPGQSISFLVNIDDQSEYDITGIEVLLNQHFTHRVRRPSRNKSSTKTLMKTVINNSTLRQSKRTYGASIVVPPKTQRTSIPNKSLISLHYELQIKLKTGLFHKDIVMTVPIVIGTVPIVIGTVPLERLHGDNTLDTMQPTSSTDQSRNQCGSIRISNNDGSVNNVGGIFPSYASCSPNTSSQQTFDGNQSHTNERQHIINLPQFPGYDTFASRTQAENYASNPNWDESSEEISS